MSDKVSEEKEGRTVIVSVNDLRHMKASYELIKAIAKGKTEGWLEQDEDRRDIVPRQPHEGPILSHERRREG